MEAKLGSLGRLVCDVRARSEIGDRIEGVEQDLVNICRLCSCRTLGRLPRQSRILRATLVLTRSRSSSPRPASMVRIAYSENPFTCSAVMVGGMVSS
jgi:hypothetical protein